MKNVSINPAYISALHNIYFMSHLISVQFKITMKMKFVYSVVNFAILYPNLVPIIILPENV